MTSFLRRGGCAAALCGTTLLAGCGSFGAGFFQDPNTTSTTTAAGSGADYVYVVDSGNYLSEFVVGSSSLTAVSGSPITLPTNLAAASVTVSRPDTYVYVGGDGAIEAYGIGTGGALTYASDVTENADFVSLDTSPNGDYLFALDASNNEIWVFAINTSTGALTVQGSQYPLQVGNTRVSAATAPGKMLRVSPDGALIAVAIGVAGDEVYTINETNGFLTPVTGVNAPPSGFTDDSVAFDGTSTVAESHLFVGRGITAAGSSTILSFAVTPSTGALSATATTYATGADPYALLVDLTSGFLYAADRGANQVDGYTLANGALTPLVSSPFTSGDEVTALAEDNGKKYVIAASAGGSSDLTMYAFDALTPGQLDAVATSLNGSGQAGSFALATTH